MKKNFLVIIALFCGFIAFANSKAIFANCLSVFNYGIFQQAVVEMGQGWDWNPYITVRGLNLFNDHFAPILVLVGLFSKLFFNPTTFLVYLDLFSFVFLMLFFLYKNSNHQRATWIYLFCALFCKGILATFELPGHPGPWAMGILFMIPFYIKEKKDAFALALSFFLLLFRESYFLVVMGLGLFFMLEKKWKHSLVLLIGGLAWWSLVAKLRPYLIGPVMDYGSEFLRPLFLEPITYIVEAFQKFNYKGFAKLFYPFVIPFIFIFRREGVFYRPALAAICMLAPLGILHFFANKFHFQYATMFVAPLLSVMFFSNLEIDFQHRRLLGPLVLILFIASGAGRWTKMVNLVFRNNARWCQINDQKMASVYKVRKSFAKIPSDQKIMVSGGFVNQLIQPGVKIYQPDPYFNKFEKNYDYLLLEKNQSGYTIPFSGKEIEKMIQRCRPHSSEKILEDEFHVFLKGKFPASCFQVRGDLTRSQPLSSMD